MPQIPYVKQTWTDFASRARGLLATRLRGKVSALGALARLER